MCLLGNPDYNKACVIPYFKFMRMDKLDLLYSYTVLKVVFKFPDDVKFPNIPVFVDKDTTVYPLEGEAVLTYAEYLTAQRMGCDFKVIKEIFHIPFETLPSKVRDSDVNICDFDSYVPDYVPYQFKDGYTRVMKSECKGDETGTNVKDLKVLACCDSLSKLTEVIKLNGITFEDFRQQPNNFRDALNSIINKNEVDVTCRRIMIDYMGEFITPYILEGMES